MANVYGMLPEEFQLVPEEGESEQKYLMRIVRKIDADTNEDSFNELADEIKDWYDAAVSGLEVNPPKPIQMLPGAPFVNGEDKGEAEPEPPKRSVGGRKAAAKPAKAAKEKKAPKVVAKKEKPPKAEKAPKAAKEPKAPKVRKEREPGVLMFLMEEVFADTSATPLQLIERVQTKHKIEVKDANAVGIRQQFRRIVKFLHGKGIAKEVRFE